MNTKIVIMNLIRLTAVLSFFMLPLSIFAQKPAPASATINVVMTDSKKTPLKGAEVLFISSGKKTFSGRTDKEGKFTLSLPAGSTYAIRLKNMNDTAEYSSFDIPALKEGQYFTDPFTVTIRYEPPRKFTLNHVHFDTGKPALRPDSFKELNEIAEYMKFKEDENYEIAGHTDNVGKDEDNLKLSQQRADAVKAYLVKKGIDAARLTAKGYGASKPVADNATPEGRQLNRRTEVVIL